MNKKRFRQVTNAPQCSSDLFQQHITITNVQILVFYFAVNQEICDVILYQKRVEDEQWNTCDFQYSVSTKKQQESIAVGYVPSACRGGSKGTQGTPHLSPAIHAPTPFMSQSPCHARPHYGHPRHALPY